VIPPNRWTFLPVKAPIPLERTLSVFRASGRSLAISSPRTDRQTPQYPPPFRAPITPIPPPHAPSGAEGRWKGASTYRVGRFANVAFGDGVGGTQADGSVRLSKRQADDCVWTGSSVFGRGKRVVEAWPGWFCFLGVRFVREGAVRWWLGTFWGVADWRYLHVVLWCLSSTGVRITTCKRFL
jgi:hypothetical protein